MERRLSEHVEEGEPVTLEDVLSSGTLAIPFLEVRRQKMQIGLRHGFEKHVETI